MSKIYVYFKILDILRWYDSAAQGSHYDYQSEYLARVIILLVEAGDAMATHGPKTCAARTAAVLNSRPEGIWDRAKGDAAAAEATTDSAPVSLTTGMLAEAPLAETMTTG